VATSVENYNEKEIRKLHAAIKKAVPKLKPSIQYGLIGYGTYAYVGRASACVRL
jgi:hypothetical protein